MNIHSVYTLSLPIGNVTINKTTVLLQVWRIHKDKLDCSGILNSTISYCL